MKDFFSYHKFKFNLTLFKRVLEILKNAWIWVGLKICKVKAVVFYIVVQYWTGGKTEVNYVSIITNISLYGRSKEQTSWLLDRN